jgi:hypothetical protein
MLADTLGDGGSVNCGHRLALKPTPANRETKMFKNRFILVLGVLALLLVTMAVTYPRTNAPLAASDFHQRHPDWTWTSNNQKAVIPMTGISASPDYFQRHPELRVAVAETVDTTDYFIRLSILSASVESADLTDYYFRQTVP